MEHIKWMGSLLLSLILSAGLSARHDGSAAARAAAAVWLGSIDTADYACTWNIDTPWKVAGYFIK